LKVVVDSNVLFTLFWEKSFSRHLILRRGIKFFSPEYALEEINKFKREIMKKTGLTEQEFDETRRKIIELVEFVPLKDYQSLLAKAQNIPDKNDIDFIALALKLNCLIWSNDKALKKQSIVEVLSTKEFIEKI